LQKILKDDYDIKLAESQIVIDPPGTGDIEEEIQTEFDVFLKEGGGQKLQVIKALKNITGLGLKDSKELVDSAPAVIRFGVFKEDAETLKAELENVGATVELR
jgi:large subunit ribosomal protein L7/L12